MPLLTKVFTIFLASSFATHSFIIRAQASEVLWDNWYTVSSNDKPESYYNERAEIDGTKAKIRVNTWMRDGIHIKSENLGATAKNTTLLEPLLYNYSTQEGGIEKVIDGTVTNNGKVFSVKVKKGGKSLNPLRAEMLPKLILVSFFPLWINKNYKKISSVQPIEFSAIVEDQVEQQVPVIKGSAYEMVSDETSRSTKTRKLRIVFNNVVAFWYVSPKGDAIQITIPSMKKIVKKTTKEIAEKFL